MNPEFGPIDPQLKVLSHGRPVHFHQIVYRGTGTIATPVLLKTSFMVLWHLQTNSDPLQLLLSVCNAVWLSDYNLGREIATSNKVHRLFYGQQFSLTFCGFGVGELGIPAHYSRTTPQSIFAASVIHSWTMSRIRCCPSMLPIKLIISNNLVTFFNILWFLLKSPP